MPFLINQCHQKIFTCHSDLRKYQSLDFLTLSKLLTVAPLLTCLWMLLNLGSFFYLYNPNSSTPMTHTLNSSPHIHTHIHTHHTHIHTYTEKSPNIYLTQIECFMYRKMVSYKPHNIKLLGSKSCLYVSTCPCPLISHILQTIEKL